MESIREIFVPENNKIILTIPDKFIRKKIELSATVREASSVEHQKNRQHFIVADA